MQKKDMLFIGGILILGAISALFLQFQKEDGGVAVVTVDGVVVEEFSLDKDTEQLIETPDGYNIISIEGGIVHIMEADCRDHICVDHLPIDQTGETIVCLPHKLVVEVVGGTEKEMDLVVG